MKREYVLVIDKGTTNLKAVLFDMEGNEKVQVSKPCGAPVSLKPGWCEQNMDVMWDMALEAMREICELLDSQEEIRGVGVTGHGSGIFLIDKAGNPVREGILSLDTRTFELVEKWKDEGKAEWFFERMKAEVLPCYPVSLLAWMKQHERENYDRIDKILFVKDWIKYKMTGKASTDYTDAGPSCLLDVQSMDYCYEVFDKMGISEMKNALPELIPSYQNAGKITQEVALKTGLKEGTPVFSGIHDMMSCPFGIGNMQTDQVVSVVGTWGMNFTATPERSGAFSFPHVIPGHFLTGQLDGNSGSVQDRMLKLLCPEEEYKSAGMSIYKYAQKKAMEARDSGLIFQPYLFGALYDAAACGGFYGLRDWHTKSDMLKAVYEGIVFGHYANIKTIAGYENFSTLWLVGGGAKSEYMAQLFADITGLHVKTALTDEVTARGVALSMLVGLGICESYQDACISVEVKDEYIPNPEKVEFYKKKFKLYEKISRQMTEVWQDMKKIS